jgi:hypothetical protein
MLNLLLTIIKKKLNEFKQLKELMLKFILKQIKNGLINEKIKGDLGETRNSII